jgi:AcrR family transcriptional regulator
MADKHDDRRVQRSRQLLQQALGDLIGEKPFDRITVQDIIDRAGVGRTTFYAHFQSKEDLFLSHHDSLIELISRSFLPENGVWPLEPPPDLIAFLDMMNHSRDAYFFLTWGNATGEVMRLIRQRIAQGLAARLHELFREEHSAIPFDVLAQQVAGSTVSLFNWWMDRRMPYPLPHMVRMVHQINQVVLRAALENRMPGGRSG